MSMNGYSWVSGNPINKIDPSGLCDGTPLGKLLCPIGAGSGVGPSGASAVPHVGHVGALAMAYRDIIFLLAPLGQSRRAIQAGEIATAIVTRLAGDLLVDTASDAFYDLLQEAVEDELGLSGQNYSPANVVSPNVIPFPNSQASSPLDLSGSLNDAICELGTLLTSIMGSSSATQTQTNTSEAEQEGPCGKVYTNNDRSDLQYLADSKYIITERPLTRRRGLRDRNAYLYVVTLEGQMRLGDVYQAGIDRMILHHPDLVNGLPVAYAGEMTFNNNQVIRWDNGSGHYLPNREQDQDESDCIKNVIEATGWGILPPQSWVS